MLRLCRLTHAAVVLAGATAALATIAVSSASAQFGDTAIAPFPPEVKYSCISGVSNGGDFAGAPRVRRDYSDADDGSNADADSDADMYDPGRTYETRPCLTIPVLFEVVDLWNDPELAGTGGQSFSFDPGLSLSAGTAFGVPLGPNSSVGVDVSGQAMMVVVDQLQNPVGQGPNVNASGDFTALAAMVGLSFEQQLGLLYAAFRVAGGPAHIDFNASGAFGNVAGDEWTKRVQVGGKVGFRATPHLSAAVTGNVGWMDDITVRSGGTPFQFGPFWTYGLGFGLELRY